MSAETLRRAAVLMRERAEAASEWNADVVPGDSLHLWVADYDPSDPTGQTPMQRMVGGADAPWSDHIASWHPAVALAVADWLDAVAAVHWPKRHDRYSDSHYNAEPEHDHLSGDCDESCWTEAYICNGCGTAECKSEISGRALAVARAYLGRDT